jgi:AraC-like DNA-binding protein
MRIFEGDFGRVMLVEAFTPLAPHAHPEYAALIKHDGADGAYRVKGVRHGFTRDDVILINSLEMHDNARGDDDEATRLLAIYLTPDWIARAWPALMPADGKLFANPREAITPRVRGLADLLAVEMLNDRFSSEARIDFVLQELTLALLESYVMCRDRKVRAWQGSRLADHRIRRALALLRAEPGMDTDIDDIATQVSLSRSRFYELFQICTGLSPRAYADMLCTQTAISRLSLSAVPISEIASDLGFSAQGNFTRFFMRQIGVAPSEYRRVVSHVEVAADEASRG